MVRKSDAFHSTHCQQCQTDACVLILACLLWSWSKLSSYSHASWGLSHFAEFKLILLFPLCSQLAFQIFFHICPFYSKKNFFWGFCALSWGLLYWQAIWYCLTSWTGLGQHISALSWVHNVLCWLLFALLPFFSESSFFPFITNNCHIFLCVKCIVKRDVAPW